MTASTILSSHVATGRRVHPLQSGAGDRVPEANVSELFQLLRSYDPNDEAQLNRLGQLLLPDLRRVAARLLWHERNIGVSLQPSLLASESIMRLIVKKRVSAKDLPHFLNIAAGAMRQMLIDHIRQKRAQRRPTSARQVELKNDLALSPAMEARVIALHQAIDLLPMDYRAVLEMHYFGEASIEEVAGHFCVSERTIKRTLQVGRLRLKELLKSARRG